MPTPPVDRPGPGDGPVARLAVTDDARTAGQSLAAAFRTDPVWQWMINDDRRFDRRAARVHEAIVRMHLPLASVWVTDVDGAPGRPTGEQLSESQAKPRATGLASVAVWAPPRQFKVPTVRALATAHLFRTTNVASLRRIAATTELDRIHPAEPHWYLAVLGTHPDAEGRGHGGAVLAPVLAAADAEGVGCYLESSKEANVAYYGRHGFEVTGTHDLDRGRGPRVWPMWRDPRPAPDTP
jgi:GNAT superfamily N-acetyltransferase